METCKLYLIYAGETVGEIEVEPAISSENIQEIVYQDGWVLEDISEIDGNIYAIVSKD